jgi:propionyl-CoA synthetase
MSDVKPEKCVVLQRPMEKASMIDGRDVDWVEAMASAQPADCVPVAATDPLYILYTSGTTGQPKGVVRDNGGHVVALKWTMKAIYNVDAGDVYWAASDVGWVVGHSYIVYGPLFKGCTTILFEGKPVGTPDAGVFWRVISQHKVKCHVHRAHGLPGHQARGSQGRADERLRPVQLQGPLSGRRAPDPDTLSGRKTTSRSRSSTTGGRRRPAGPSAPTAWACITFRSRTDRPPRPAPGWNLQVVDANNQQVAAG